jgi:cytochrome c-type biogenesis protein CcmH
VKLLGSFRLWALALVVVCAAALVLSPHGTTSASRIAHLESLVRCPSCEDLSVAQSTSTSALAVRAQIERAVHAGDSDTAILTSLERVYGPSILLSPSTSGLGVLLWLVPSAALVVLVVVFVRLARRR